MVDGKVKVPITFHVLEGDEVVRSQTITEDVIKIGTLDSSHLRVEDEDVSRMHAVVEVFGPDEVHVIDLGSTVGTLVNGRKINKANLRTGDEIVLGRTRLIVEIGEPGEVMAEEAPVSNATIGYGVQMPAPQAPPPRVQQAPMSSGAPAASLPNPFALPGTIPGAIANPFATPMAMAAAQSEMGPLENEDNVQYQLIPSGPPVNPAEVDSHEPAVEIVIMWGDYNVIHAETLSPPRAFLVGEATDSKGKPATDFLIGSESIGTVSLPVTVESGSGVAVVIPPGASGEVNIGEQRITFDELAINRQLQPCGQLAGAQQYTLPSGATATVGYRGFTFVVRPGSAARRIGIGGKPRIDWSGQVWTFASAGIVALMLLMFYFLPPTASSLSLELLNADSRLVKYLIEPPETMQEETPEWLQEDKDSGKGKRHKDEEGQMGDKKAKKTNNKFGIEGPKDNQDPHMAREEAKEQAANAGIIGLLKQNVGAWNSPTSPYGRDTALGNDPMSALGALMGDQIGANFGFGGLGLRGTGRGGGGTGEGTIGLGNIGTIGHGAGGGDGSGYGRGAGSFRDRNAKIPTIRTGKADVRGSLSKEVIRRIIHRHINEVRFCYEQELNQRPDLEGRVSIKFIISPTGAVQTAVIDNSTVNNAKVDNCIAQAVRRWTFPAPEGGGIVVVTYPFVLSQAGGGQ